MTDSPSAKPVDLAGTVTFDQFLAVDVRVGRIVGAQSFPRARKPSYKLRIDFGKGLGLRDSSAQLAARYQPDELVGRQVVAVVNLPPRQIADFRSEVLVLGVPDAEGNVVLLAPDAEAPLGGRVF